MAVRPEEPGGIRRSDTIGNRGDTDDPATFKLIIGWHDDAAFSELYPQFRRRFEGLAGVDQDSATEECIPFAVLDVLMPIHNEIGPWLAD